MTFFVVSSKNRCEQNVSPQPRVLKLKPESFIPGWGGKITSLPTKSSCNNTVSCSKLGPQSSKEIRATRATERKTKLVRPLASNSL